MTPAEIDSLNDQIWDLLDNDARRALELCPTARQAAEAAGYTRGLAYALRNSGECHTLLLDYPGAMADLLEALRLFREIQDALGEGTVLNAIGKVYFRLNDYPPSLDCYTESLRLRRQTGDRRGEAGSLNNIGLVYFDMARYLEAHEYHAQSLKIHEEIGNQAGAAIAINNLGLVYEKLDDMDSALDCHLRSLAIKQSLDNLSGVCASLNNLGDLFCRRGDYERALDYNCQGLEIARQTNHRYHEVQSWVNMGEAHQALGDLEQALVCYERGLEILHDSGDGFTRAETLISISDNYSRRGLPDRALDYLQQALELGRSLGSNELISRVHQSLSVVYETQQDAARALEHYKAYHEARAALFTEELDHRKRVLQVKAEIDRMKTEAEIHRLQHVELAQAYRDLEQATAQKSEMLQTLHQQTQELERLTREDALTGLSTRRHLEEMTRVEFERARRFDHDLTIAMVDIDDFKRINDDYSHQDGDAVLQAVAQQLKSGCRSVDVVGRYGGEEFMILLVETGPSPSLAMCERLRATVQNYPWEQIRPGLAVTVSIGLANRREAAELAQIIALSDARLYRAKQQGKNRVCADD